MYPYLLVPFRLEFSNFLLFWNLILVLSTSLSQSYSLFFFRVCYLLYLIFSVVSSHLSQSSSLYFIVTFLFVFFLKLFIFFSDPFASNSQAFSFCCNHLSGIQSVYSPVFITLYHTFFNCFFPFVRFYFASLPLFCNCLPGSQSIDSPVFISFLYCTFFNYLFSSLVCLYFSSQFVSPSILQSSSPCLVPF